MPITVEIADKQVAKQDIQGVFDYFISVDERFSTYKDSSEISKINQGLLAKAEYSTDMNTILTLSEQTKQATNGYFDIQNADGTLDPSGLVKGWAIQNAAEILLKTGFKNFYVEAGGDTQTQGYSDEGVPWTVGIKNPFNQNEIVKILSISGQGVATSGTYIRGQHIYNPHNRTTPLQEIVSITVIGPNIYEADRFATAAFAMGRAGITFIETLPGLDGYMIDKDGIATYTAGFEKYVAVNGTDNLLTNN